MAIVQVQDLGVSCNLSVFQAGECEAKTGSEQAACYKAIIDIADRFDKKDVAENARKGELREIQNSSDLVGFKLLILSPEV